MSALFLSENTDKRPKGNLPVHCRQAGDGGRAVGSTDGCWCGQLWVSSGWPMVPLAPPPSSPRPTAPPRLPRRYDQPSPYLTYPAYIQSTVCGCWVRGLDGAGKKKNL